MFRLSKKIPSVCTDDPLSKNEVSRKMTLMRQILISSFGPNGRLKQVHNNVGGPVLTTSTSSSLLQALRSTDPLLKLINASILNHLSRFSDCGLYVGILCLSLISNVQRSGLRPSVAISLNQYLLGLCTSYLKQEDCGCKVNIDFGSSQNLVTLARSVISSKPACVLTEKEQRHISTLVVHAFLLTVPFGDTSETVRLGRIVRVCIEGQSVLDSAVFQGLLVDAPDMLLPSTGVERTRLGSGPFRLALFTVSLSGDLSVLGDGSLEVHRGSPDPEDIVLDQLLRLGEQVVRDQVDVFMCQRVIHPVLQHFLRRNGVLVVERLGVALIEPIVQMTGAQAVAVYQTPVPPEAYGQVKEVCVRKVGLKEMLHLMPCGEPALCTMVISHRNETMLNELKSACQKVEYVLRLTLRDPAALLGGGCTETHLAAYCRSKGSNGAAQTASSMAVSQSEFLLGLNAFCLSLEAVSLALEHDGGASFIDLTHAHCWSVPSDWVPQWGEGVDAPDTCRCGLVERSTQPAQGVKREWTLLNTRYPPFIPASWVQDSSSVPLVKDTNPLVKDTSHLVKDTNPLVEDTSHLVKDTNPLVKDTYPLVKDTNPLVKDTNPLVKDTTHLVMDTTHLVKDTIPLVKDTTPLVKDTNPLVKDTTLLVKDTNPLVKDTSHLVKETTPLVEDNTYKPRVLDSFTAKLNALQVAVETANLILDIRYIIQDVN
ncbi:hypothetical protein UPYG_G00131200 [Umbra pygmaea]|uniref:McKusick-Kaufman syndrome n=1 Tax=Umbra pygmaea TaxID=75934 RepID=A0ABD0XFW9_UMBPY